MSDNLTAHIAKNIEEFYFGGNWTDVSLRDSLKGLDWRLAQKKIEPFHSISELVYHINYFIAVVIPVLEGKPLKGKDAESFDVPEFKSRTEWDLFLDQVWADARKFTELIRRLPDEQLDDHFTDEKYGTFRKNLNGIIEHSHYHLGQITLLRKMLEQEQEKSPPKL